MRKKVIVFLEVSVDDDVPIMDVREHIAKAARQARDQYNGCPKDWRAYTTVRLLKKLKTRDRPHDPIA